MKRNFCRMVFATDGEDRRACEEGTDVGDGLKAGTLVEVRKVSPAEKPMVEPGAWGAWVMGSPDNGGSLPVGYALEGVLLKAVKVGEPVSVLRVKRNGIMALGEFTSTAVLAIHPGQLVETVNSVYIVRRTEIAWSHGGEEA